MRLVLALIAMLLPAGAHAQAAATLVADSVTIPAGGDQLIADGNVEVFFEGTRLSARRITFDQPSDRLVIEGPIFIVTEDGTVLTADAASLDPQLENGILRGARLVLDEQLQLAANQIDRVGGRYTQLTQVAATSCHVCAEGGTPLWEIRARRVVHDLEERQLYFDDATFRVVGVPILWLPRMRLPDPTLARATGFMIPRGASSDTLGIGIKFPYFIRLGDHRDLTITPYISTSTKTLEAAYRQAFINGEIAVEAAVSRDKLQDDNRGYIFVDGIFDLGRDITLRFDAEYASDDDYLLEYGYSSKDRLDTEVSLERVRDRDLTQASITYYSSLRAGETSATLPPLLADIAWERRVAQWGGTLTMTSDMQSHYRETNADVIGRDVARLGAGVAWQTDHVTNYGLVIDGTLGVDLDYYNTGDDTTVGDSLRSTAYAQTTLRYPMIRSTDTATHIIEPMVQLAWADSHGDPVVNEDSTSTEFDQANLLGLSRFAGEDAVETGLRGAVGLTWTRMGHARDGTGWDSTLTVGRVFRDTADLNFSTTSGLRDRQSDWLLAGQLRTPAGFGIDTRLIFDDALEITKTETRATWSGGKLDLAGSYIFLPEDFAESRSADVSEWTIDAGYTFNDTWSVGVDARYDVAAASPTRTALQVGWQNECVTVDFSVSRRFTSSTTLTPSTDFGLTVGLNGFSAGRSAGTSHRCTD